MTPPEARSDPLAQIVDLQFVRQSVDSPDAARRLAGVSRALRFQTEPGVPKHRAARLLGVSPQALERWVTMGRVPTSRRHGSSRQLIDRDALIELLAQTEQLRGAGERRPVAKALAALAESPMLARRLAPNQSARELRYEHERSTPATRVRSAVALSQTALAMAARGRARRSAGR